MHARVITWEAAMPGTGVAVSPTPRSCPSRKTAISCSFRWASRSDAPGCRLNLPPKLWWVVMDAADDAIVNAGRLTVPGPDSDRNDSALRTIAERGRTDPPARSAWSTSPGSRTTGTWQVRSSTLPKSTRGQGYLEWRPEAPRRRWPKTFAGTLWSFPPRAIPVYVVDRSGRIVEHSTPR